MKSVKRKVGGLMTKRSADRQDIGAVLAEFNETDEMLERLIKDLKLWKNNWEDVLKLQYDTSEAFATIYKQIEPINDPEMRHIPAETPNRYMQKCLGLQKTYQELRDDLKQEIGMIDAKLLRPAESAKANTKMLHKTLKHRENMKRDYERYLGRAEHVRKKENKSMKEEAALAKSESELAQAQIDYEMADEQIRENIPPVSAAVVSLVPFLLANQVMLQTTLVGQLYTILDAYCKRHGLPSPAPSDAEIIANWEQEFTGFRKELEGGIATIAHGKVVQKPMTLPLDRDKNTVTGLGIRNKVMHRKPSNHATPSRSGAVSNASSMTTYQGAEGQEEEPAPPQPPRPSAARVPSYGGGAAPSSPHIPISSKPGRIPSLSYTQPVNTTAPYDHHPSATYPYDKAPPLYDQSSTAGASTPPSSVYHTPPSGSPLPTNSNLSINSSSDYFEQHRRTSQSSLASSAASVVASKKKPPPPVPAKRFPSSGQAVQYVTALYDFEAQGPGDLAFREGERIRVVRKTDSLDDWWDGELGGRKGTFPANYVRV